MASLFRSALVVAALGASAAIFSSVFAADVHASGRGSDDDDDFDEPDFDEPDIDEPDTDWGNDYDDDNSGPGNGDDFDRDDDFDNSGSGSGDDDDYDNSGPGGGDDDDDDFGTDDDNSGPGGGDDDDVDNSGHGSNNANDDDLDEARDHAAEDLAENALYSVEYDSHGAEFVPGEIVFVGAARDLAVALELGFRELAIQTLASGGTMARLAIPSRTSLDAALSLLAGATPGAIVTPNNIYRSAQSQRISSPRPTTRHPMRLRGTLGVIDTGVDAAALPNAAALLSQRAFAGSAPQARDHGSMVASIAVSRGLRIHVADVFGRSADGALAASAERIAAALDWMIANGVAVVNISVEGPDNAILGEMVRRAAQRGHIIVAAAGNGGPAAGPTFPAAFDGVLAVTAIDETGRPYIRANRGAYIDFAAHGVNVNVGVGDAVVQVSGTSFAAPVIAAEAAAQLHAPSPADSARVLTRLRERAEDLGAPGRDHIFGWGALRD